MLHIFENYAIYMGKVTILPKFIYFNAQNRYVIRVCTQIPHIREKKSNLY